MIKTFTQDDVVRYLYNETSSEENKEIAQALICDAELQSIYKELSAVKNQLELGLREPSDTVVDKILDYSRQK